MAYWLLKLTDVNRGTTWIYYKDWAITLSFQVQIKQIGCPLKAKRHKINLESMAMLDFYIWGMISSEKIGTRKGNLIFLGI